jgi:glycine cleavage system H protein
MNTPTGLKYSPSHEWVEFLSDNTVRVGLTDFAQTALGDLVFVNILPGEGDSINAEDSLGDVESVKAVSDVFCPVSGTIKAINPDLADAPEKINDDPYGAWLVELEDVSDADELLSAEEYEALCNAQEEE